LARFVPQREDAVPSMPAVRTADTLFPPGVGTREFVVNPSTSRLFATVPDDSAIEVFEVDTHRSLGRLPLRGAANLSPIRPMGIACSAERKLVAVGSRNGAVYLVKIDDQ